MDDLSLMLDGNALAGILMETFSIEMTLVPVRCASCGREGELATLHAYTHGPGCVLRCPTCRNIVMRIVQTPTRTYVDARGAAFLCLPRQ